MSRAKALEALRQAKAGRRNAPWFATRAVRSLPRGLPHAEVEPAMRLLAELGDLLPHLQRLPDEYVPLVRAVLAARPTSNEALFLEAWGDDLHAAARWRAELTRVNDRRAAPRLAKLLTPRGVEAAQATVAKVGLRAPRLLAVLAADGSESSLDVVLPLVHDALRTRGPALDVLEAWVKPFARGPHFTRLLAELGGAADERGQASPLTAWLEALEVSPQPVRLEVNFGCEAGWSLWLRLDSTRLPHFSFSLNDGVRFLTVEDGKVRHARMFDEPPPESLAAFPEWLAKVSRARELEWLLPPVWVKSTLRGRARARAVAWVLSAGHSRSGTSTEKPS